MTFRGICGACRVGRGWFGAVRDTVEIYEEEALLIGRSGII